MPGTIGKTSIKSWMCFRTRNTQTRKFQVDVRLLHIVVIFTVRGFIISYWLYISTLAPNRHKTPSLFSHPAMKSGSEGHDWGLNQACVNVSSTIQVLLHLLYEDQRCLSGLRSNAVTLLTNCIWMALGLKINTIWPKVWIVSFSTSVQPSPLCRFVQ